ncbi:hypothetical protein Droror1_Dr00018729 [Drosera rotundifolia]
MGYNLRSKDYDDIHLGDSNWDRKSIVSVGTVPATVKGSSSIWLGVGEQAESSAAGDFIIDLSLGTLGVARRITTTKGLEVRSRGCSSMESLSSTTTPGGSSSKRARVTNGSGSQVASCLVDGCDADLSKCRDYHRRHKVCEVHSKTPVVTIAGQEQRFCQQCSRFHSLEEFDEGKRSCRKRLEGHNRRRRKPQPESIPMNHGSFLSAGQGSRYLPFGSSAMIPSSSMVSSTWTGSMKPEATSTLYSSSRAPSSPTIYANSYRGRQFPFLQVPDPPLPGSTSCAHQSLHDHPSSMAMATGSSGGGSGGNPNHKLFSNGLTQQVITDTDRALSLLSSSPAAAAADTHDLGFSRMMHQPNHTSSTARPLISSLHQYGIVQAHYPGPHGLEDEEGGSVLHCPDVFQGSGHDGSSAGGPHQTLSFSWG